MSEAKKIKKISNILESFKTMGKNLGRAADSIPSSSMDEVADFVKKMFGAGEEFNPDMVDELGKLKTLKKELGDKKVTGAVDEAVNKIVSKGDINSISKNAGLLEPDDVAVIGRRIEAGEFGDDAGEISEMIGKFPREMDRVELTRKLFVSGNPASKTEVLQSVKKGGKFDEFADGVGSACKKMPTGCTIGKGVLYTGAAAGLSVAAYKFVDEVFLDDDDKKECVKACLPAGFFESDAPGAYGDTPYKDLDFKTYAQLSEAYGADFDESNQPLCTINTKDCKKMCQTRCGELHRTLLEDMTKALTDPVKDLAEDASEVAGTGFSAFLKGLGLSMPGFIGIVIGLIILIVIGTTMM